MNMKFIPMSGHKMKVVNVDIVVMALFDFSLNLKLLIIAKKFSLLIYSVLYANYFHIVDVAP